MSDEPLIVISPARFILPKNMNKVGLGKGELENKGRRGITDLFDDEPTIANKINIDTEKLTLPPPLLWDTLPSVDHPDYAHIINKYAQETIATMSFICQSDEKLWTFLSEKRGVKAFYKEIHNSKIEIVRHQLEIDAPASIVLDLYNRLNYTWCVDAYTYDLYGVEAIPTKDFKWLQVVHTVDQLPLPLKNIRDFVTLDFVDPHRMMLVSKSVVHPKILPVPQNWIRSPLCYALRVEAINENKCKVVQVQWSDIAGMLPPEFIKNGVENFGFEFYHRFIDMVDQCKRDKLDVGNVNSNTYLESPLKNGWIRQPIEMVPGLHLSMEEPEFPFPPLGPSNSKL